MSVQNIVLKNMYTSHSYSPEICKHAWFCERRSEARLHTARCQKCTQFVQLQTCTEYVQFENMYGMCTFVERKTPAKETVRNFTMIW